MSLPIDTKTITKLTLQICGERKPTCNYGVFFNIRRRSVQYHYAASSCRFIKCPRDEEIIRESTMKEQPETKPRYFDCDPSCHEATYFHYRKAEVLVSGREYGNDYI